MFTLATLRADAKALAQNATTGTTGVQLLLTDPGDYNVALMAALRTLDQDTPKQAVADYTLTAAAWRWVLGGDGTAILPSDVKPDAPTAALAGVGAGLVDDGTHTWFVSFVMPGGESQLSDASNILTVADKSVDGQVDVAIAVGPTGCTARKVWRKVAGNSGNPKLVATVPNNTDVTYRDNVADAGLGVEGLTNHTPLTAWVIGASGLVEVWTRYDATVQGQTPDDTETWRVVTDPGDLTVLELIADSLAVGEVLRLVYTVPYQVHESLISHSNVPNGLQEALTVLGASLILQTAAAKAVQNTGNTSLPNDVVDRRTQSDMFRSRAKELRDLYGLLVGKATGGDLKGHSAVRDLDVPTGHGYGFLWHPSSRH